MSEEENSGGFNNFKSLFIVLLLFIFIIPASKAQDENTKVLNDNAVLVSQSVPGQMFSGHTYRLFVRFRNTGTTIWTPEYYRLALVKDENSEEWDFKPIKPRSNVERGSDVTFGFQVKAPSAPGEYKFKLQMEAHGNYFGDDAGPSVVHVSGNPVNDVNPQVQAESKGDNSQFLMQIMTNEMEAGSNYEVSITMQNNGKTTWVKKDGYALGFPDSLLNIENNNLKFTKIVLSEDVPPGKEVTFHFTVKAPDAPGTYEYRWKMEHDNLFFGEPSDTYSVKVE